MAGEISRQVPSWYRDLLVSGSTSYYALFRNLHNNEHIVQYSGTLYDGVVPSFRHINDRIYSDHRLIAVFKVKKK